MQTSITTIKDEIAVIEEETQYMDNFKIPYLESERAPYFLGHENGVLYEGEYVIRLRQKKILKDDTAQDIQQRINDPVLISSPKESRHHFFADKLSELEMIGIHIQKPSTMR